MKFLNDGEDRKIECEFESVFSSKGLHVPQTRGDLSAPRGVSLTQDPSSPDQTQGELQPG